MLSIYENFIDNIQNSNNSQNEEDVWFSIIKPINDTYYLNVELFYYLHESNKLLACKLAVMYKNKDEEHEKAERGIVDEIKIKDDKLLIKNSNNDIIYDTRFPSGRMDHDFAIMEYKDLDLGEFTGLLEFSFNYEIKFKDDVSGNISGSLNSNDFDAVFIYNGKIVKKVFRPRYLVLCNVLDNGNKINFDIIDILSNKKTLLLNGDFLLDNNIFNIKIGGTEISKTRKNKKKKFKFKQS